MPIRLLTFDLDDTLWDTRTVLVRAERAVQDWLRAHYPQLAARLDIQALTALRQRVIAESPQLAHDLSHVRRRALQIAAEDVALPARVGDEAFAEFMHWRSRVTPFDDAIATLDQLSRRYTLISLTNGNADLSATPLGGFFQHQLSPTDVGSAKPHPAMFLQACALVDIAPQDAVHIGDDPTADIGGAQAAGLRCVWFNRHGKPWPGGQPAEAEVRSLAELPARLVKLQA